MLDRIRKLNPDIPIYTIDDIHFKRYGLPANLSYVDEFIDYLNAKTEIPQTGNKYVASDAGAERLNLMNEMQNHFYGEMPVEIGWCNGHNQKLNAMEYHKGNEVDVAATPSVLLLASVTDVKDGKLSSSDIEAFYMEKGQAVELFGTTFHFSPCAVSAEGFRMGIILPRGTNEQIDLTTKKDATLWMRNKWLFAHPDAANLVERGAYIGISGDNIEIRF